MSGFSRKKLTSNISLIVIAIVGVLLIVVIANKTQFPLFSKAQQAGVPCFTLHRHVPVPPGWGASFDVFGPEFWQNVILTVNCLSDSVNLEVAQYRPEQYIYKTGYLWKGVNRQTVTFAGTQSEFPAWLKGSAKATVQFTPDELKGQNAFAAYVCERRGADGWKCGCADSKCSQSFWNLQKFTSPAGGPAAP